MQKSTKTIIFIAVLILIVFAGLALIFLPNYIKDLQLTREAEEIFQLNQSLKIEAEETSSIEAEPATPLENDTGDDYLYINEEDYIINGDKLIVSAVPFTATETIVPESEEVELGEIEESSTITSEMDEAAEELEIKEDAETEVELEANAITSFEWNPFEGKKVQSSGIFDSKEKRSSSSNDNEILPPVSDDAEIIMPIDDPVAPDEYNDMLIETLKTPTPTPEPTATPKPTATPEPTPKIGLTEADLSAAKKQNGDFVAWIKIPGTNVDYPIVGTNDIDYYLGHTFDGRKSELGTLFSLGKSDWKGPAKNIAIYGHDVEGSGKKMFKKLLDYKSASFYVDHAYIYLDSLYRTGVYQIFAVFDTTVGDFDPSTSTFASNEEFLKFVNHGKELSLYNTNVKVTAKSTIITLITCDRYFKQKVGRFVVMAVKIA